MVLQHSNRLYDLIQVEAICQIDLIRIEGMRFDALLPGGIVLPAGPEFSQQTFDQMRRLIHKMEDKAVTRRDEGWSGDAEVLLHGRLSRSHASYTPL